MPDDVGGKPFPDGEEPDEHGQRDRGEADEEFAAVVLDEDFVRSAPVHEPTAMERMLAAARARAEAERFFPGYGSEREAAERSGRDSAFDGCDADEYDGLDEAVADGRRGAYSPYGPYGGALRPYRASVRWHRPVAWVLALLMGIGLVALAFTAVYRGASGKGQSPSPPPATSGVDGGHQSGAGARPSAPVGQEPPPASAVERRG